MNLEEKRDSMESNQTILDIKKEFQNIELLSPETKHRRIKTLQKEIDFKHQNIYKVGKSKIDKRILNFIVQNLLLLIILVFAISKTFENQNENITFYLSIISTILGIVIPSPSIKN